MLLSPSRLYQILKSDAAKTVVLDSTWFMPNSTRIAAAEFRTKRIPGARFLDLDEVASPHELGLKHMLPSGEVFARACEKFGIGRSDVRVVMYDSLGVFSSPRALWMFKSFGHQNTAILDGGLPRWEAEGLPLDQQEPPQDDIENVTYPTPTLDSNAVRSYGQMVYNSGMKPSQFEFVLDARSRGRYLGTDPEPRPGLSSGHIPNSFSLPFNLFLQNNVAPNGSSYTTFLSEPQLRKAVVDALGADKADAVFKGDVSVIATCGSGMTAAILWLGLQLLGVKQVSIYDESWTGYALRPASKIEKSQ
ncbi:Rhodanese-like domain-containing protein [Mycena sanguinolenta]|nr:Rhodanese-like domain-containing protein [Mycena sanguinolenta]